MNSDEGQAQQGAPDVNETAPPQSPPPPESSGPGESDAVPDAATAVADEPAAAVASDEDAAPQSLDAQESEQLADEISAEFSELDALIRERDEYLDSLRRLQADFENYRKRMQRQEADASDKGAADLALRLLPVLDTVELALAHHPGDAIAQVAASLDDVLAKEGLERVPGAGSLFDPNEHDAVLHEEGDGPAEVLEVLRSGYRWRGRVLRAAMVKVKGS